MRQYSDQSPIRYRLMGTVNHFGTLNRGHYYAEVKHTDGRWYEVNDEVVREANVEKYSNKSKYVYILFYQKQKWMILTYFLLHNPINFNILINIPMEDYERLYK